MLRKNTYTLVILILIMGILITGYQFSKNIIEKKNIEVEQYSIESNMSKKSDLKLSAWITYWDTDTVLGEVCNLEKYLENICYFAAYFDYNNNIILPEKTTQIFEKIKKGNITDKCTNYLTFVNDKVNEDKSFSLKDTELLYELFTSEDTMDKHIEKILLFTIEMGYDGIEIDYESIKKDMSLWELYETFCKKLYLRVSEVGIKMRVILEPNIPINKLSLPEGPEYIMMCYNLYGAHSKPGPKADAEFISEIIKKMSVLKGNISFALATGGFDWNENGKTKSITEIQAVKLTNKYKVESIRDTKSQCIKFTYYDEESVNHEVWYADTITINYWIDIISKFGEYGISIWRLGGNNIIIP